MCRFQLINQRKDVAFLFFYNVSRTIKFGSGNLLARSADIRLHNPNDPQHIHLALGVTEGCAPVHSLGIPPLLKNSTRAEFPGDAVMESGHARFGRHPRESCAVSTRDCKCKAAAWAARASFPVSRQMSEQLMTCCCVRCAWPGR